MENLSARQEKFRKRMLSPLAFFLFSLWKVPMGRIAGMKVKSLTADQCKTTVPFRFLNRNPFRSMYFAVQSMAAELSTAGLALLTLQKYKESIAVIIVDMKAEFSKKATGKVTFTCDSGPEFQKQIEDCVNNKQAVTVTAKTIGTDPEGTIVSTFYFTWSFKVRN